MRILSKNQLDSLQADMTDLLSKYGLTAAYLVAEIGSQDQSKVDWVGMQIANQPGYSPGTLIRELAFKTNLALAQAPIQTAPVLTDN